MKPIHMYLPLNKPKTKFENKSKSMPFFQKGSLNKIHVVHTG